jgi:hypothetical protein
LFVNSLEFLGLKRKLLSNTFGREHRHKVLPQELNLKPLLNSVLALGKKGNLISDSLLEWLDESHSVPLVKSHDGFFELLLDVSDVSAEDSWLLTVSKLA